MDTEFPTASSLQASLITYAVLTSTTAQVDANMDNSVLSNGVAIPRTAQEQTGQ